MTLTKSQRKALEILRDSGATRPREFAKLMWPESPAWQHHAKCGHGSHRGGGMYLAAGGFLGKLRRLKLVSYGSGDYCISQQGREALRAP